MYLRGTIAHLYTVINTLRDASHELRFAVVKHELKGIWVVVKIMVPFWVPIIIRPLIFRVPKKGP